MAERSVEEKRAAAMRMREIIQRAPPLPDIAPPFPVEPPLDAGLSELAAWWLEVRCECGHVAYPPLRRMAAELGWRKRLRDVLPRLRCRKCRARPATLNLIANPADGALGAGGGLGRRLRLMAE